MLDGTSNMFEESDWGSCVSSDASEENGTDSDEEFECRDVTDSTDDDVLADMSLENDTDVDMECKSDDETDG
ncbi:unnamed protein product [Thlaspi arvense]|uniref:Uncharacterized protein n=1 Tax=Thlaspi arvense TaxID=13288 RepID=A0AAU9SKS6_THLAR|nr:unnamed protein product [Thlaspi arvense]